MATNEDRLVVSNFAAAEFSSVVARRVRMHACPVDDARNALLDLDLWSARWTQRVEIIPADVALADGYLRRFDVALLTPDALHIAAAERLRATLATFDRAMAAAAQKLGVPVADA